MWESYSCYPSFFCFGVLKFSLQHYQSAKTTEWRCKQMIVWFRDIIRSSISTGFTVLLLIFSAISSRLIWTIFLTGFMMYWDKCWALAHVYRVKFNNAYIYFCWCCKLQFEESSILMRKMELVFIESSP